MARKKEVNPMQQFEEIQKRMTEDHPMETVVEMGVHERDDGKSARSQFQLSNIEPRLVMEQKSSGNVKDSTQKNVNITYPLVLKQSRRRMDKEPCSEIVEGAKAIDEGVKAIDEGASKEINPITALIRQVLDRIDLRIPESRTESSTPNYLQMVMLMKNLGTTPYRGGANPLEAEAWIQNLKKNFSVTRCPEEFKTDIAIYYLEEDALNWWNSTKDYLGGNLLTWRQFKHEFRRKYFPPEARDRLESQFMKIQQGTRTVREYEVEFARLRRYTRFGPDQEDTIIRRFLGGLRPDIRSRLQVVRFQSLYKLIERAVNVEEGIAEENAEVDQPIRNQNAGLLKANDKKKMVRSKKRSDEKLRMTMKNSLNCYQCGSQGHTIRQCSIPGKYKAKSHENQCFHCGEDGHYARACNQRQGESTRNFQRDQPSPVYKKLEPVPKRLRQLRLK